MFTRYCCEYLKEYKVLDKSIIGVRRSESRKRTERYSEPTACVFYGRSKKNRVEQIYPILDWTDDDVEEFIADRGIKCAPVYYDSEGVFHVERRLGCMCCPLQSRSTRVMSFEQYPRMVKAYIRAGQKYRETHMHTKTMKRYRNVYEWFTRDVFFTSQSSWDKARKTTLKRKNFKKYLEDYFRIEL